MNALDTFCRLTLESDLSDEQLTRYAALVVEEIRDAGTADDLIASFKAMTAVEFAQRVKRSCNGNATSTSNDHTRIHRETRGRHEARAL